MLTPEKIIEVLKKNQKNAGSSFFINNGIRNTIPEHKLTNAKKSMRVDHSEEVFALLDATIWGSAKNGALITQAGLYLKDDDECMYIDYATLKNCEVGGKGSEFIINNGEKSTRFFLCGIEVEKFFVPILNEYIVLLNGLAEWHIAIDSIQQGPFLLEELIVKIKNGEITPSETIVWRDGMDDWTEMSAIEEFIAADNEDVETLAKTNPPPVTIQQKSHQPQSAPSVSIDSVDINNADVDEILLLPGITLHLANLLVQTRAIRLGFTSVEEIASALELKPHITESLRPRILFSPFAVHAEKITTAGKRIVDF